jgi:hypothetical protein
MSNSDSRGPYSPKAQDIFNRILKLQREAPKAQDAIVKLFLEFMEELQPAQREPIRRWLEHDAAMRDHEAQEALLRRCEEELKQVTPDKNTSDIPDWDYE